MQQNDELQIYRGNDFIVNDKIKIHQPTLNEICDWGEEQYFSFIYSFTATPTDMKYPLSLSGIDWNEISDYELFLIKYKTYEQSWTKILFGNLDFTAFEIMQNQQNDELVLYDKISNTVIDRFIHEIMTDYIRRVHHLKKNVERAMNENTKNVLIEEAKEQMTLNKDKSYTSHLLPLISTLTNMEGFKYSWSTVWEMKINAFMDSVTKIQHIKNADLLLTSGYSGFGINLKEINKNELNYFYRPDET